MNVEQLKEARAEVERVIRSKQAGPIIVRLGWHDSGTFDKNIKEWPQRGGAVGSIRFKPEIGHGANAGLQVALDILGPLKENKLPDVSYADLFQMASATSILLAGGPRIPMRYGRRDARGPDDCAKEGNLPAAGKPFPDGSVTPAEHLRKVFNRMGLEDKEIVALSGAHTIGRSRPTRSGWGKESTPYTSHPKEGETWAPGGQSWTVDWLNFNNAYFVEIKEKRDAELLVLPTDAALFEDEGFRQYAEKYAADEKAFFEDYAESHKKLSELGVEWVEGGPVTAESMGF